MKKINLRVIGLLVLAITIMFAGMLLPGIVLYSNSNGITGKVNIVPKDYYAASNSAMAKNNSKRMKVSEKIQLITGSWKSTIKEANKYETELKDYEATNLALKELSQLYEDGLFPSELQSKYGNWYSWTAKGYKAVDSIFNTYSSCYWVSSFMKYDGTENHEVYMIEDGTIICCVSHFENSTEMGRIEKAYDVYEQKTEYEITDSSDNVNIIELIRYPIDTQLFNSTEWSTSCNITKENENYNIVQAYTKDSYLYQLTDVKSN